MIREKTKLLWKKWIIITKDRCHLHFELEQNNLDIHIKTCLKGSERTAERISEDIKKKPKFILDIGSSVGFNCFSIAKKYKKSTVFGIEPDEDACKIANSTAKDLGLKNIKFVNGLGETLPFSNNFFDLIISHTVIEHVKNVDKCIDEMARVLRPEGYIHIEAPNYIWPWEPHLSIFTTPLCSKPLMKFLAKLQKVGDEVTYIDHLQPVNPIWLERLFKKNNLKWDNRAKSKYLLASIGETKDIAAYKNSSVFYKFFLFLKKIGVVKPLTILALKLNFYPSILYTVKK